MIFGSRWPIWCGRRTPVSAREGRTVAELLDDSDGLAREALLDMSADPALGMVRGWPQLIQSIAELWTVIPGDPTVPADGDPITSWRRWAAPLAGALPQDTGPGGGPAMRHGSRSRRALCRPGACSGTAGGNPELSRPTARSAEPPRRPTSCTLCMSPHTPPRWP
jgi:hypothetical protein